MKDDDSTILIFDDSEDPMWISARESLAKEEWDEMLEFLMRSDRL